MYKESTLDNGLKIFTYEDANVPVIDMRLIFRAGSRYEGKDQKGYAHILEHMLMKGTTKRPSPILISQEIDNKGGYRNAFTGRDYLSMVLQAADNYSEDLFELLSDMFFNSLIDPQILENEKRVIVEELNKAKDNVETFFIRFTYEKFFSGHPLSTNILGDQESIMSATTEALIEYKNTFLIPNNSCIVVAGNISHEKVVALAEKYFNAWEKGENAVLNIDFKQSAPGPFFLAKDLQQTSISYSMPTVSGKMSREIAALDLVRNFLNFGSSSILNEELRHKRGLVYTVGSSNFIFSDTGVFIIRTSTSRPKEAVQAIDDVIRNLKNKFTESLLPTIKNQYIGSFKLGIANPYHQTDFLADSFRTKGRLVTLAEYLAEVENITYPEIVHVIDTYLTPQKAVIAGIGPKDFTV